MKWLRISQVLCRVIVQTGNCVSRQDVRQREPVQCEVGRNAFYGRCLGVVMLARCLEVKLRVQPCIDDDRKVLNYNA